MTLVCFVVWQGLEGVESAGLALGPHPFTSLPGPPEEWEVLINIEFTLSFRLKPFIKKKENVVFHSRILGYYHHYFNIYYVPFKKYEKV